VRLSRSERRASILAAATAAFARGGYDATSMNDLAAAAGVTPLILYRHFESKEDLYRQVVLGATERQRTAVDGAPTARFGIDTRMVLAAAREDPAGFTVLWRHAVREALFAAPVVGLRRVLVGRVRASLADTVEQELTRWAAEATVGYLIDAVLTWLDHGSERHDQRFVAATDAAMRAGVRAWTRPLTDPPRSGARRQRG